MLNQPSKSNEVENFAKTISASVKHYAGKGQYPDDSDEQKAYLDGVQTAVAMMYVDLTGGAKSKGMLRTLIEAKDAERAKAVEDIIVSADVEKLAEVVHKAYCQYKKDVHGEDYWTGGDYSKLDDKWKEADRYTVRAILKALTPPEVNSSK